MFITDYMGKLEKESNMTIDTEKLQEMTGKVLADIGATGF